MIKNHILLTKELHSSSEYSQLYIIVYILYNPTYLPCLQKSYKTIHLYNCPKTTAQLCSDQKTGIYAETDSLHTYGAALSQVKSQRHKTKEH